jgi:branched-chain amino acid transport system permease protein
VELFLTVCVTALSLGLLYALFGLGMGVVLRASGHLNLAHGDSLMLATYVALGTLHLSANRPLGILAAVVVGAAIGTLAHLLVYAPVAGRSRTVAAGLSFLPSLGVALIVRNLAVHVDPKGSRPFPAVVPGGPVRLFFDYRLPPAGWWLLAVAVVVPVTMVGWLRHGRSGRRVRAVADDPVLARATGLPVNRTLALSYAVAGAVGGLAGVLFSSFFGLVFVAMGWQATLKGFVAALLGGAGWVRGALVGGLALGAVESATGAYVSSSLKDVATFALLIAALLLLPRGLTARAVVRDV